MAESWREFLARMPDHESLLLAFIESIGPSVRSPELREKLADHYQRTREVVAASVRESLGDASRADAETIASWLIAIHDGFVLQFLVDPARTPSGDQLVAALGAGLAAATAGAQR
jgi:BetI-type transcriptional repressor, C-terminal